MSRTECPPASTLSAWLDDELSRSEAQAVRSHAEECPACREQTASWLQALRSLAPHLSADRVRERGADCPDDETLVTYGEAALGAVEAARIEQHLGDCAGCVGEVQRLVRLRVGLGQATAAPMAAPPVVTAPVRSRVADVRAWFEASVRALSRPWPAVGAIAASAAVVILVVRFVPFGGDEIQFRGVSGLTKVEVIADEVIARARPSENEPVVATLGRGTMATRVEEIGDWTRIELADGRRMWVRAAALSRLPQAVP
ncbi:MAG: zf-HC2 domain-containing protein [Deltaproteobacteria bacterium]|nr:zf-HC2 domain-containing protein [Deltaproteobacteria bacterium]